MWTVAEPSSFIFTTAPPPGPEPSIQAPVAKPMPWFLPSWTLPQPIFSLAVFRVSASELSRSLGTPTMLSPFSGTFFSRNSMGSMPSSAAMESMWDSMAKVAWGPPGPRTGPHTCLLV